MTSEIEPYKGSVKCTVQLPGDPEKCGMPAVGRWRLVHGRDDFCCGLHADVCLVAGMYEGPLSEPPEGLKLLMEADDDIRD